MGLLFPKLDSFIYNPLPKQERLILEIDLEGVE